MPSCLVLRSFDAPFLRFVLAGTDLIVGRSRKCEFVIDHQTVSRRHARILGSGQGYCVLDLESLNGTFLDGRRVQKIEVSSGQTVRFGGISFFVLEEQDQPVEGPEIDTAPCDSDTSRIPTLSPPTLQLLTGGQRRIFDLLVDGQPEKTIAKRLDLSPHTVHHHVRSIFRLYDVHSKAELLGKFVPKLAHDG